MLKTADTVTLNLVWRALRVILLPAASCCRLPAQSWLRDKASEKDKGLRAQTGAERNPAEMMRQADGLQSVPASLKKTLRPPSYGGISFQQQGCSSTTACTGLPSENKPSATLLCFQCNYNFHQFLQVSPHGQIQSTDFLQPTQIFCCDMTADVQVKSSLRLWFPKFGTQWVKGQQGVLIIYLH